MSTSSESTANKQSKPCLSGPRRQSNTHGDAAHGAVLGPVGAYASQTHGNTLPWVLVSSLLAWTIVPLGLAVVLFARRGSV